jgi:hypothetical protein
MNRPSLLLSIILLLSFPMSGCIDQNNDAIEMVDSDDDGDCVFNLVEQELGTDALSNDSDNDSYLDTYDRFPADSTRYKLDNESFIRSSCYYGEDTGFSNGSGEPCEESDGSLSENSQESGCETQNEIAGKVSIISAWISNNQTLNSSINLVWELSAGSSMTWEDEVAWQISCGYNDSYAFISGEFVGNMDLQGDAGLDNLSNQAEPGQTYMINLKTSSEELAECPITLNEDMVLWIHVEGGGSTYETLSITDASIGALVI